METELEHAIWRCNHRGSDQIPVASDFEPYGGNDNMVHFQIEALMELGKKYKFRQKKLTKETLSANFFNGGFDGSGCEANNINYPPYKVFV